MNEIPSWELRRLQLVFCNLKPSSPKIDGRVTTVRIAIGSIRSAFNSGPVASKTAYSPMNKLRANIAAKIKFANNKLFRIVGRKDEQLFRFNCGEKNGDLSRQQKLMSSIINIVSCL